MGSIAQSWENEKNFSSRMREFFSRYQVGEALKQSNAYKKQGYTVGNQVYSAIPIIITVYPCLTAALALLCYHAYQWKQIA